MVEVQWPSGSKVGVRLRRLLSLATAVYAFALVIATHYPRPQEILLRLGAGNVTDKTQHFTAYLGLALLAAATLASWGRWTLANAAMLLASLALFGAVDEVTQPLFGRHADPADWGGDCTGIVTGVLVVAITIAVFPARRQASR